MRAAAGFHGAIQCPLLGVGNESWAVAATSSLKNTRWSSGAWVLCSTGTKSEDQINSIDGFALHHYAWNLSRGKTPGWDQGKRDALEFGSVDWYELLLEGQKIEDLTLVVDEWSPWYKPGSERTLGDILEQATHVARCRLQRYDPGYLPPQPGKSGHGQLCSTHQRSQQPVSGARRQVPGHARWATCRRCRFPIGAGLRHVPYSPRLPSNMTATASRAGSGDCMDQHRCAESLWCYPL